MKTYEKYLLIIICVAAYFFALGILDWQYRLALIVLTLFGIFYTKYMIRFITKFYKLNKKSPE